MTLPEGPFKTFDQLTMLAHASMADTALRYRPSNASIGTGYEVLIHIERGPFSFAAGSDLEACISTAAEDFKIKFHQWKELRKVKLDPPAVKSVLTLDDLNL